MEDFYGIKDVFTTIFFRDVVNKLLTEDERKVYQNAESYCNSAFQYAKKQQFETSDSLFIKYHDIFIKENTREIFKLMLIEAFYPKRAYYFYKVREYNKARKITLKTILINELLKKKAGTEFLVLSQIQQYQNIARIAIAQEDHFTFFELNKKLVTYLLNGQSSIKFLKSFNHENKDEKLLLIIGSLYQLLVDLILFTDKQMEEEYKHQRFLLLSKIISQIQSCVDTWHPSEIVVTFSGLLKLLTELRKEDDNLKMIRINDYFSKMESKILPQSKSVINVFCKIVSSSQRDTQQIQQL